MVPHYMQTTKEQHFNSVLERTSTSTSIHHLHSCYLAKPGNDILKTTKLCQYYCTSRVWHVKDERARIGVTWGPLLTLGQAVFRNENQFSLDHLIKVLEISSKYWPAPLPSNSLEVIHSFLLWTRLQPVWWTNDADALWSSWRHDH